MRSEWCLQAEKSSTIGACKTCVFRQTWGDLDLSRNNLEGSELELLRACLFSMRPWLPHEPVEVVDGRDRDLWVWYPAS